ncbi:hypothetical protein F220043C3_55770 [Enterocloster asparagiformis]
MFPSPVPAGNPEEACPFKSREMPQKQINLETLWEISYNHVIYVYELNSMYYARKGEFLL